MRLLDHRRGEQRRHTGDTRDGGNDGQREPDPASHAEAILEPIGDRGEIDRQEDGEKEEQQDVDDLENEQDGEGRNKERHERGARQPGGGRGRSRGTVQLFCSASSSSSSSASFAPLPSALACSWVPPGSNPILRFSASSCSSAVAFTSIP